MVIFEKLPGRLLRIIPDLREGEMVVTDFVLQIPSRYMCILVLAELATVNLDQNSTKINLARDTYA